MSDTSDDTTEPTETEFQKLVDVGDRLPKWYDDVFDKDGNLARPASVLDDEFL